MNVSQVADSLGITPGAVRRAISDGKLGAIRTGGGQQRAGLLLVERDEVERYRREHLGKRGVAAASHPLHGVGRRKKSRNTSESASDAPRSPESDRQAK
jgi:excisionase family DNA binding protein